MESGRCSCTLGFSEDEDGEEEEDDDDDDDDDDIWDSSWYFLYDFKAMTLCSIFTDFWVLAMIVLGLFNPR